MSNQGLGPKARFFLDIGRILTHIPGWARLSFQASGDVAVPEDFFGINVASAPDPQCDDYVIAQLRDLGMQQVRLAWDDEAANNYTGRFLERLLSEGFAVMVLLVPANADASKLETDPAAAKRWRALVVDFLENYGNQVTLCEVGSTPNRPRWSGLTPRGYLTAWHIAAEEAAARNVDLAGPNVSDFEPAFNLAYLKHMQSTGYRPRVHTDNLFVERSKEPEQYDPSALGSLLARPARLNLAKKINIFKDLSQRYGVERTYCTYTCWTSPRLARWSVFPAAKGADYLVRYLVICAASGGLQRVYWGPLVDHRDGLIDCGNTDYPVVDNVTNYKSIRGALTDFSPTPAYFAFRFITGLLQGTYCQNGVGSSRGVNHYAFSDAENTHHIVWAPDARTFDLRYLYPEHLSAALVRDVHGQSLSAPYQRNQIGESPLLLTWPKSVDVSIPDLHRIRTCPPIGPAGTLHMPHKGWRTTTIANEEWLGIAKIPEHVDAATADTLLPERLHTYTVQKSLRDKRNKLWTIHNPTTPDAASGNLLVVKQNRARGVKRFSYLLTESKGKRHWNNASTMLRRGINTPQPIAYVENKQLAGIRDNYYIAEHIDDAFSTRDLFTAFAEGDTAYRDIAKAEWLAIVARFVAQMHIKRIIHRDLSSGNILIRIHNGTPELYAIDIGRARIDRRYTPAVDIKRICYKLSWPDRKTFVTHYQQAIPRKSIKYWRTAIYSYELKQKSKKWLKGLFRRKNKTQKPQALTEAGAKLP
ncbi:MAG: lipopolysaccharide kinase InaA family protein [Pseudomonadota bacterium]